MDNVLDKTNVNAKQDGKVPNVQRGGKKVINVLPKNVSDTFGMKKMFVVVMDDVLEKIIVNVIMAGMGNVVVMILLQ